MTTIHLDVSKLRDALHCVSNEQTRFYLCGVCVSADRGDVTFDATDGRVMYCARQSGVDYVGMIGDADASYQIIIPTQAVKTALSATPKKQERVALVQPETGNQWRLGALSFEPVPAAFPGVERVIPEHCSGELAQFSSASLVKVAKALKLDKPNVGALPIAYNGDGAAIVSRPDCSDEFCIIMPVRRVVVMAEPPAWARFSRVPRSDAAA